MKIRERNYDKINDYLNKHNFSRSLLHLYLNELFHLRSTKTTFSTFQSEYSEFEEKVKKKSKLTVYSFSNCPGMNTSISYVYQVFRFLLSGLDNQ